jgi:hypothetical protein
MTRSPPRADSAAEDEAGDVAVGDIEAPAGVDMVFCIK